MATLEEKFQNWQLIATDSVKYLIFDFQYKTLLPMRINWKIQRTRSFYSVETVWKNQMKASISYKKNILNEKFWVEKSFNFRENV